MRRSIARRVADDLGAAVRLNTPVRAILQRRDHVVVESAELTVSARHAIVAVPPALALEIAFDPVLPEDRLTLYRHSTAGPETKTLLVYDEPFWRADGFSGQSAGPKSASEVTIDATPASGTPGVIASFTFGPVAERVDALDAGERRRLVLEAMVERFGPRAGSPSAFIETPWWKEEWTRGCSMAHWSQGILTRYGSLLPPAVRTRSLGGHRDRNDLVRRDRRRRPLRRACRRRDPGRCVTIGAGGWLLADFVDGLNACQTADPWAFPQRVPCRAIDPRNLLLWSRTRDLAITPMRLLVITLATIENEFEECVESIARQTYRDYHHIIFRDLASMEANRALYGTFMNAPTSSSC